MFTKLKERLAQEASKFPGAQQALTPGRGTDQNARSDAVPGLSSENQSEDLIALNDSPAVITPQPLTSRPDLFSIADEDEYSSDQNSSRRGTPSIPCPDPRFSIAAPNSSSDAALMSSYVSQSETEEPATLHLDDISKEQLLSRIQDLKMKNNKYKSKFREVFSKCKQLQGEKEKIESTLLKTQDQSVRRISELQETCVLEKNAKAHLESNLRLLIEEKDSRISVLETQIALLKESQINFDDQKKPQSNEVSEDDDELPFAREGFQEVCENSLMQKAPLVETYSDPHLTISTPSSSEMPFPDSSPSLLNFHALQNETEELSMLNFDNMSREQLFSKIRELTVEKNNYKKLYETYSIKQQSDPHFAVMTPSSDEVSFDHLGSTSSIPNFRTSQNETGELSILNLDNMSKEQLFSKIRELTAEKNKYKENYEIENAPNVLENVNKLTEENEQLNQHIKKLRHEIDAFQLKEGELVVEHERMKYTVDEKSRELQNVTLGIAEMKQNMHEEMELKESQIKKLQEENKALNLEAQNNKKLTETLRKQHDHQLKEMQEKCDMLVRNVEEDKQAHKSVLQEKGNAIVLLQQSHEKKIATIECDYQRKIKKMEQDCEKQIQSYENIIKAIEDDYQIKIQAAKEDHANTQDLQKELENLTKKYSDVVKEKNILEKQFEIEKKECIMGLQKRLEEVSKLCEQLQEDKSNNMQILENHITEINQLHEKICELENEKQAMVNSQDLQQTTENLTEEHSDDVTEKNLLMKQFEAERNEWLMENQKYIEEVARLSEKIETTNLKNAQDTESYTTEIIDLHRKIWELEVRMREMVNAHEFHLQQTIENFTKEHSDVVAEKNLLMEQFEAEKNKWLMENQKYVEEVARLSEKIETAKLDNAQDSESYTTEINDLHKKIWEMEVQIQETVNFENKIQILISNIRELQENLQITMQENRKLKDNYDHLGETLKNLNPQIQQMQQQNEKQRVLFAEQEHSHAVELNSVVMKNKALDEKLVLLDASYKAKDNELKTLKEQQMDNISKTENKMTIIAEAYKSEIGKLNKRIEELQSQNEKLEKIMTDLPGSFEIEKSSDDELSNQEKTLNLTQGSDSISVPGIRKVQQLKSEQLDKVKVKSLYMMKLLEYSGICGKNDLNEIMKVPLEAENLDEILKNFCINKMNLLQAEIKSCQPLELFSKYMDKDRTNQNVTSSLNDCPSSSNDEIHAAAVNDITENLPAMTLRDEGQQKEVFKSVHEYYEKIVQEKTENIKMLEAQISQLNKKSHSSPCENLNISPETSDWDDAWVVPDEECEPALLVSSNNEECQNHLREIESMKSEMDSYKSELNELRLLLRLSPPQFSDSIESNLPEPTELEYLKNIMYQFMLGKEPAVLAKVIAAVLKFDERQTKAVLDKTKC